MTISVREINRLIELNSMYFESGKLKAKKNDKTATVNPEKFRKFLIDKYDVTGFESFQIYDYIVNKVKTKQFEEMLKSKKK